MTIYTKRDMRAADMLALILFGFGVVLSLLAMITNFGWLQAPAVEGKPVAGPRSAFSLWLMAVVFLMLGAAMNLKVRQLVRNKGREPDDYAGVPDSVVESTRSVSASSAVGSTKIDVE